MERKKHNWKEVKTNGERYWLCEGCGAATKLPTFHPTLDRSSCPGASSLEEYLERAVPEGIATIWYGVPIRDWQSRFCGPYEIVDERFDQYKVIIEDVERIRADVHGNCVVRTGSSLITVSTRSRGLEEVLSYDLTTLEMTVTPTRHSSSRSSVLAAR